MTRASSMTDQAYSRRTVRLFVGMGLLLLIAASCSLCIGKYSISPQEVAALLAGKPTDAITHKVFFVLRLPRTVLAVLSGAGLGLAGSVYQSVFKNPLASPDIIGVSPGANLGAAAVLALGGSSMISVALGAFLGGVLSVAMVMLLVRANRSNTTSTYVLSGIIISAMAKALIMLFKYYADSESKLVAIEFWTMGSLASVTAQKVRIILPIWVAAFAGLFALRRQIQMLSLNEDECRALGVRLQQIRTVVLLLSTLLVSSVVCVTGLIAFAGLIPPHIAGMMMKRQNTQTMALSTLAGGVVLLLADTLARTLYTSELPISILTTLIGVPILLWFMHRRKESRI